MPETEAPLATVAVAEEADVRQLPLWERVATLIVIMVPIGALVLAMVLAWGWGVGWLDVGLLAAMYVATGLGITIGFHRLFTHRSFTTGRVVQTILAVLGSMACEGTLLKWVATHRCHHQHSDSAEDPHSPHRHGSGMLAMLRGFWDAHIGWMFEPLDPELMRYVADFSADRWVRFLSAMFPVWVLVGLLVPGVIGGVVTQSWWGACLGVLWGGLVRILVVHHLTWSINSVCHIWGTRPFQCHDESRNNLLFGVLAFGEGWHNNHHAFPTSARHGLRWWEIDVSYLVIRLLARLGLASRVRTPTRERIAAKRVKVP